MKAYWDWRYIATHSLTSALDGNEWSASRPGRFTSRERAPGTHWIEGWVDAVVKRKIRSHRRDSNPRTLIVQPIAQRYTDWAITVLIITRKTTLLQCMYLFYNRDDVFSSRSWHEKKRNLELYSWHKWRYVESHNVMNPLFNHFYSAARASYNPTRILL
jgi:hypothetical protein